MSHQFLDMTANFAVVRSVLFSPGWSLRLNHLHQYLCSNLRVYATECTAVYPPTELMQVSAITFFVVFAQLLRNSCNLVQIKVNFDFIFWNALMLYLQLRAASGTSGTDLMIVSKSYESNKMTDLKQSDTAGQPPASQENPHKPSDKHILNPSGTYV